MKGMNLEASTIYGGSNSNFTSERVVGAGAVAYTALNLQAEINFSTNPVACVSR